MSSPSPLSHSLLAACDFDVVSAGAPDSAQKRRDERPTDNRRVVNLLDALASLLVSEPKHEVIAIGASAPAQQDLIEIFVASNGNKHLAQIQSKLEEIWNFLVSVKRTDRTSPELMDGEDEFLIETFEKLRTMVYEHNWRKVMKRFEDLDLVKLRLFFDEVLRDGSKYVSNEPSRGDYIFESERRAVHVLGVVVDGISRLMAKRDMLNDGKLAVHLVPIGGVASVAEEELKSIRAFSKDTSCPSHDFFDRCDRICKSCLSVLLCDLNVLVAVISLTGWSAEMGTFYNFFRKVYKAERHILDLMRLVYSPSFGDILDRKLKVTAVWAEKLPLEYDVLRKEIRGILKGRWDDYEELWIGKKETKSAQPIDVQPHCECTLLAHFLNNGDLEPYHYIGTSKLSCTGCWLFFKACNEARADVLAEASSGEDFLTRGTHSKACIPWVAPLINDERLGVDIERRFCEHLKARLVELSKEISSRKWMDSASSVRHVFRTKDGAGNYVGT